MQTGYFKINENVNCGACDALNEASSMDCVYCGANFHLTPPSSLILQARERIDALLASGNVNQARLITQSITLSSPIVEFRRVIIELNDLLTRQLIAQVYRKHLDKLSDLTANNNNYFKAYTKYIYQRVPVMACALTAEDYRNIIGHGLLLQYDTQNIIGESLRLQLAMSVLGFEVVKEIKFYNEPDNQIDDAGFQKRKKYFLETYSQTIRDFLI